MMKNKTTSLSRKEKGQDKSKLFRKNKKNLKKKSSQKEKVQAL